MTGESRTMNAKVVEAALMQIGQTLTDGDQHPMNRIGSAKIQVGKLLDHVREYVRNSDGSGSNA